MLFTVPWRPNRRCGWRVLRRRPRVWLAFHVNRLLGRPYCHCCFTDGNFVRSSTFGTLSHYPLVRFLDHPALEMVVLMWGELDIDPDLIPAKWSCVSDVRQMLGHCGIETGMCFTPSGLHKQLMELRRGEPV